MINNNCNNFQYLKFFLVTKLWINWYNKTAWLFCIKTSFLIYIIIGRYIQWVCHSSLTDINLIYCMKLFHILCILYTSYRDSHNCVVFFFIYTYVFGSPPLYTCAICIKIIWNIWLYRNVISGDRNFRLLSNQYGRLRWRR